MKQNKQQPKKFLSIDLGLNEDESLSIDVKFNTGAPFVIQEDHKAYRISTATAADMIEFGLVLIKLNETIGTLITISQNLGIMLTVSENQDVKESYEKTTKEEECSRCGARTTGVASLYPAEMDEPKQPLCEKCARELGFDLGDSSNAGGSCEHKSDSNEEREASDVCPKGEKGLHGEGGKIIDFFRDN